MLMKNSKDMLTLSLPGGGVNNTFVCLKDNNYDIESLALCQIVGITPNFDKEI